MQISNQQKNCPALECEYGDSEALFNENRLSSSVEDHFYDNDIVESNDLLVFQQPSVTKTLSFNDCDDAHLANDLYDQDQCERQFSAQDRNSSDETVTESNLEDASYFSFKVHNDIDVFLSGQSKPSSSELSDLFFRRSPISSPDSSAIVEGSGMDDYAESESEWQTNNRLMYDEENITAMELSNYDVVDTERLPLISREGLRRSASRRGGYQQNRVRKSDNQVGFLKKMYEETGGKLDRRQRKRITQATGLSWIQIYKWIFDMQTKETESQAVATPSTAASPYQIFRVIGRDGKEIGKPLPIFKVEKVVRPSSRQ